MTNNSLLREVLLISAGMIGGLFLPTYFHGFTYSETALAQNAAPDLAALQADVAHLKEVVPSQSHSMTDVGFQFANLWFAGKQKNWPLAEFFLNESRQHIEWTIRIRPVRKDAAGNSVDLKSVFETISNGPLKTLSQSIQNKDSDKFEASYKQMLNGCYGCHVASGKPFLRPIIPTVPPQTIISFQSEGGGSN